MIPNDGRLRELAREVPPGPWLYRRGTDGALLVYDADGEPIAHVYGGVDLAKWIVHTAPERLGLRQ